MRQRVGLARDVYNNRTEHRKRNRQFDLEARSLSRLGVNVDAAADRLHHRMNHVESHAAAGNLRYLGGGGKSGQKKKIQEFGFAELVGHVAAGKPALDNLALEAAPRRSPGRRRIR